jgi:hypothetical protein
VPWFWGNDRIEVLGPRSDRSFGRRLRASPRGVRCRAGVQVSSGGAVGAQASRCRGKFNTLPIPRRSPFWADPGLGSNLTDPPPPKACYRNRETWARGSGCHGCGGRWLMVWPRCLLRAASPKAWKAPLRIPPTMSPATVRSSTVMSRDRTLDRDGRLAGFHLGRPR